MTSNRIEAEKTLAAVCGLYCPACRIYIGTRENPKILEELAALWEVTPEELHCDGCRAERRNAYCAECRMSRCAAEKGLDFCGECEAFPCPELSEFQQARPHRIRLFEDLARIREVGWEQWMEEKAELYACPNCRTVNSAYDLACRSCGRTPSSKYTEAHDAAIREYLANPRD